MRIKSHRFCVFLLIAMRLAKKRVFEKWTRGTILVPCSTKSDPVYLHGWMILLSTRLKKTKMIVTNYQWLNTNESKSQKFSLDNFNIFTLRAAPNFDLTYFFFNRLYSFLNCFNKNNLDFVTFCPSILFYTIMKYSTKTRY